MFLWVASYFAIMVGYIIYFFMKYFFAIILMVFACTLGAYAAIAIPGGNQIENASIIISGSNNGTVTGVKDFWFQILSILKIAVSGVALVYIVLIGAYMVIGSDSEEAVKTQRKQITYAMIAFLFLNIPSFAYTLFFYDSSQVMTQSLTPASSWPTTVGWFFWNSTWFDGIFGNMVAFLRVFIFGAAVTMFTWWFFSLILSGGDDEKKKIAKNRIVYGIISLLFAGFVGLWGTLVAVGDFTNYIPTVGKTLFSLAMYFVAPVVIFMLMYGAYFIITSAGNEERVKKWKSIFINTGIAVVILLTALSFMTDLIKFQL